MAWYDIIGLFAAVCIAVYMMPQLIKIVKSKDTTSISIFMVAIAVAGDLFFVINGIGIMINKGWNTGLSIFLANLFGCVISAVILFYKIRNLKWAKKYNLKENEIPEHFNEIKEKIRLQKRAEEAAEAKKSVESESGK